MNYRALSMARKEVSILPEIQENHEGICKGCAQGKNVKKTFPSSERKEKGIPEIVHSVVCGPMYSSSLSKYVYYVSFIDYFSRKTWIYFLKGKNEVFNKFKEFKSLVENHTERKIKTLQLDHDEEFTFEEFKELYREYGIKRALITPYNPQHNGITEQNKKTIMEGAKAMLHD